MFKRIMLLCMAGFVWFFCAPALSQNTDLSQAIVIDVRTEAEWQAGHLEGVELVPWEHIVEASAKLDLDKNQTIALFCRSGNRAGKAMALLNAAGYSQVVNLGSLEQAADMLHKPIIKPSE